METLAVELMQCDIIKKVDYILITFRNYEKTLTKLVENMENSDLQRINERLSADLVNNTYATNKIVSVIKSLKSAPKQMEVVIREFPKIAGSVNTTNKNLAIVNKNVLGMSKRLSAIELQLVNLKDLTTGLSSKQQAPEPKPVQQPKEQEEVNDAAELD